MVCAYLNYILMSLHLGLHWNMMLGAMPKGKGREKTTGWVLRVGAIAIAAYGVYALIRRQIGEYLFLQTHFLFLDPTEPIIFLFMDYMAIVKLGNLAVHTERSVSVSDAVFSLRGLFEFIEWITLILDEVHHLDWGRNSSLDFFLVEGRKKGVRLLMASSESNLIRDHGREIMKCDAIISVQTSINDVKQLREISSCDITEYIQAIREHGPLRRGEYICLSANIVTEKGNPAVPNVLSTFIPE